MQVFSSTQRMVAPSGGEVYSSQIRRTFGRKSGSGLCNHKLTLCGRIPSARRMRPISVTLKVCPGLCIRLARAINKACGRRGAVWGDRYHTHSLTTPRETRHAMVYVLMNFRKHHPHDRRPVDPCSSAPWFDGFRSLATNGIEKPVLNVFRMFGLMGRERVEAMSSGAVPLDEITRAGVRGAPDVGALASRGERSVTIMVWHYHDDDVAGPDAEVALEVAGISETRVLLHHYRVDRDHSNSYEAWKRIGSPQQPAPEQYAQLEEAARLERLGPPRRVDAKSGAVTLGFRLPRQGVSLVELRW